jgi:hypothetical protein
MSRHSFDPEIAAQVGLNAAVIYQNIYWWCERNAAKEKNIRDGRAWTYNPMRAFETLFPYLSSGQIRTALARLEDCKLVEAGNYNKSAYDRTKWYCVIAQPHLLNSANGVVQNGQPLPVSKPVSKLTPINPQGDDLFSAESNQVKPDETSDHIEEDFKEFYDDIWPKHLRKKAKADCRKVYMSACAGKHPKADKITSADLNRCARAYITSVTDKQFLKGTLPWLREPGWEPFMDGQIGYSEADLSKSQKSMLIDGIVPPSMLVDGRSNTKARYWLEQYGHEVTV